MANVDAPSGFTPIRYASGHAYTGAASTYYKDATAGVIGVGDPVIKVTNSSDPLGGPEIVRATTGSAITGVVVGIMPVQSNLNQHHLAAADVGYVLVADDPNLVFMVKDNGGATGMAVTDVGQHIDSVAAINANTTTGRSNYEIDTEAKATDNTWILVGAHQRPDNDPTLANAKWEVMANLHTEVNASATSHTEV